MNTTKKILPCLVLCLFFSFSYAQESNKGTDAGDYSAINPIQRYEVSTKGTDAGDYSTINPIQRYETSEELDFWSRLFAMLGF